MSGTGNNLEGAASPSHASQGRGSRPNHSESSESQTPFDGRGRGVGSRGNRGQRRGRGRGQSHGRGRENASSTGPHPFESAADSNSGRPPGGGFGARLTEAASKPEGDSSGSQAQAGGQEEEGEVCFICASPIAHISIAPCNHQTCHICSLRLRALYKTRACAHCRVSRKPQSCVVDGKLTNSRPKHRS